MQKGSKTSSGYLPPPDLKVEGIPVPANPLPFVSVVIPCYNEEKFIADVLANFLVQYDPERIEIVIVDGMSTDRTREVVNKFMKNHTKARIRMLDNPRRNIPTALNLGIKNARGDIIVRMDAHAIPSKNYVRRVVELLQDGKASIVGMPWHITPTNNTASARAIALAVSHPFGIGDAKYRLKSDKAEFVDTVPFGAFYKSLWDELNGFDEQLLANEDYDFFYRARSNGKRILLDPSEHSIYFARPTFKDLGIQYARYGSWKAQMVKLHPRSIKLRQLIAPAFVLSIIFLPLLGLYSPYAFWLLLAILTAYTLLALLSALLQVRKEGRRSDKVHTLRLVGITVTAFFLIHVAWGSSFLLGMLRKPR